MLKRFNIKNFLSFDAREDGKAEEYFYKVLNMIKSKLCKCDGQSSIPSSAPSSFTPAETVEPVLSRENNLANE